MMSPRSRFASLFSQARRPLGAASSPGGGPVGLHPGGGSRAQGPRSCDGPASDALMAPEGDHQLEKLEFALAVALTRGDQRRSHQLREQIEALGGNHEEPGT